MSEKNQVLEQAPFNEDIAVESRYEEHWSLFRKYQDKKEQTVRFFNKNGVSRNIIDYVRDSVDRMNEHHLKPAYKEDWQNNVFDPVTRDKLIAILSKMASSRMKPQVGISPNTIYQVEDAYMRKTVYDNLLEGANLHNNDQNELVWEMYTAMSEGTIFGFESWKKDSRDVEYVKEYNPDTGEKKVEKIKMEAWDDVYGEIVPIEEMYPETIWTHDWNLVHRCFWAKEMSFAGFRDRFKGFKNASMVQPAGYFFAQGERFDWGISSDVEPENVQVLQFYDEVADKMGIWANGIEIYYGCLPWNHKKKPFWMAIFEPIHHQFLFGKSLPDKLMGMQDVNNASFNGMLDQLFLALNSPIFVDGMVDLEDGYLEPGRIYEVDPGARAQRVTVGQIDQTALSMLELVKRSMESSSVSSQAQGIATGGRKTKFEVQSLNEGAFNLASLFLTLMESSMRQKYLLRMNNILQYYSQPSSVKSGKPQFKFIKIDDTKLTNGRMGTRMVQIVGDDNEIPNAEGLQEIAEKEDGKKDILESRVEPIFITTEYLTNREFELELRIIPDSSIKETDSEKARKDIAFYQATAQNPLFDQEINARDFARAFDKPDEIVKSPDDTAAMQDQAMQQGQGQQQSQPVDLNAL